MAASSRAGRRAAQAARHAGLGIPALARQSRRIEDPQTGQPLDATTFYLATLFEWQGWDRPAEQQLANDASWRAMYFRQHRADKWDRAPLLRVDYLELRSALGLPKDQKYVSPLALNEAKIVLPETREQRPFVNWAEGLTRNEQEELTEFEQKAVELADRLWSYQDHRMGNRLELVPMPANTQQQWLSVAGLMHTAFDDKSDPAGVIRKIKDALQRAGRPTVPAMRPTSTPPRGTCSQPYARNVPRWASIRARGALIWKSPTTTGFPFASPGSS